MQASSIKNTHNLAIFLPIVLLAIGFFNLALSPTLSALIIITGLWSVLYTPLRRQLLYFTKTTAFWFGLLFFVWMCIRMYHVDAPITHKQKLHYFLHYFHLWLPLILLPPLFTKNKYRNFIFYSYIASFFILSLLIFLETNHYFITLSIAHSLRHTFHMIETEPVAVGYVIALLLSSFLTLSYKKNIWRLIIGALLFLWFSFSILYLQFERVGVILYFVALLYLCF